MLCPRSASTHWEITSATDPWGARLKYFTCVVFAFKLEICHHLRFMSSFTGV